MRRSNPVLGELVALDCRVAEFTIGPAKPDPWLLAMTGTRDTDQPDVIPLKLTARSFEVTASLSRGRRPRVIKDSLPSRPRGVAARRRARGWFGDAIHLAMNRGACRRATAGFKTLGPCFRGRGAGTCPPAFPPFACPRPADKVRQTPLVGPDGDPGPPGRACEARVQDAASRSTPRAPSRSAPHERDERIISLYRMIVNILSSRRDAGIFVVEVLPDPLVGQISFAHPAAKSGRTT